MVSRQNADPRQKLKSPQEERHPWLLPSFSSSSMSWSGHYASLAGARREMTSSLGSHIR